MHSQLVHGLVVARRSSALPFFVSIFGHYKIGQEVVHRREQARFEPKKKSDRFERVTKEIIYQHDHDPRRGFIPPERVIDHR